MKKPQSRADKIKALTAILKEGKTFQDVLPSVDVTFLELQPGQYFSPELKRFIQQDELAACVNNTRERYPGHIINTTHIHFQEYKCIEAELEASC